MDKEKTDSIMETTKIAQALTALAESIEAKVARSVIAAELRKLSDKVARA